ncbi:MAG: N-acetyl sugar amidotransferase [Gammaproteobacteria bacterium TMED104]|nr:MAG: N-acetyl sugar amidotransferase [Gammaproteobacteria bacterium TMED104]
MKNIQICTKCIYDETTPSIEFNESGICNYCLMIDQLSDEYGTGRKKGKKIFESIITKIKSDGRNKEYDCVIGVSGGTDSSYMLHMIKEWGLRPLAVHYDNTWNTSIATQNIKVMLDRLGIDLYTHVVDNSEADSIFKAFFYASVPELDAATDLALAEVLYRAANHVGVKYIIEGHSFKTEGVAALGDVYFDGKYISSINKKFGTKKIKTYPLMTFMRFMKWVLVKRIKKIRPLWYLDYSKESARKILEQEYGWKYYGGHHLENRLTAFVHTNYLPQKFGRDLRDLTLSAKARSGIISREAALKEYRQSISYEPGLVDYFKKRLEITDNEYKRVMSMKTKTFRDYPSYKKLFETLRPLFYLLYKSNLVPKSFYIKYTSKNEI